MTELERKMLREVAALDLPPLPDDASPITEAEVAALPPAARRYLRFMGVVGSARVRAFAMRARGRFLFDGAWVPCECAQYNRRAPIARVFHMTLRVKSVVPVYVRDLYLAGHGRMSGRVLDLVSMVDDAREEVSVGECVTYLNDAVLMAPSMLLSPEVAWSHVDDGAFDLALTDAGRTVRARVFVDAAGAVTDFSTTDRYYVAAGDKGPPTRTEWRTPVDAWQAREGPCLPQTARAVWMLPGGALPYVELEFELDGFDVDPPLPV